MPHATPPLRVSAPIFTDRSFHPRRSQTGSARTFRLPLRRWFFVAFVGAALPSGAVALTAEIVNRTTIVSAMDTNGPVQRIHGISADGRFTLFGSFASNLLPGDTNREADLFLHDAVSDTLERIALPPGDTPARLGFDNHGDVSDDGRFVVFDSHPTDTSASAPGVRQIYLRDRSAGTTTLLTRLPGGTAPTQSSAHPRFSADARYVVFETTAAFDPADTNFTTDVYRLDRQTGQLIGVSVSIDGRFGNGPSYLPQISADGGRIAFHSTATNLVADDTNGLPDLLLHDIAAGATRRVSLTASGAQLSSHASLATADALSADGRYVVFNTSEAIVADDTNGVDDGYRYDSQDGSVQRVTLGVDGAQLDSRSEVSTVARNGATVLMQTQSANVVAGQPFGNGRVFLRALADGTNTHVTFRTGAEEIGDAVYEALMGDDGHAVVGLAASDLFAVGDDNDFTDVIRQDGRAGAARRLTRPYPGLTAAAANQHSGSNMQGSASSADGRYVAFGSSASNLVVGDVNGVDDVFVRDRLLGTTERVSVGSDGVAGVCHSRNPDISDDGRFVTFDSCSPLVLPTSPPLTNIYRRDRLTQTTELVSRTPGGQAANSHSWRPSVSADGRHVAFASCASDLVAGHAGLSCDVYVRDMQAGTNERVTRAFDGGDPDIGAQDLRIAGDGSHVALMSWATNLVAGDTNGTADVFLYRRADATMQRVSVTAQGAQADGQSHLYGISHDGLQVLFGSDAANFGTGVGGESLFLRDSASATTELLSRSDGGAPLHGFAALAAMSADAGRVAFFASGAEVGDGLLLLDRDRARLGLVHPWGYIRSFHAGLTMSGDGSKLLVSTGDNDVLAEDGNNHFVDVILLDQIEDHLFADDFAMP